MKWEIILAWASGAFFMPWIFGRLKRVDVDENWLYVSNYISEERIPLSLIEGVSYDGWSRPPFVTIHLKEKSSFGTKIVFTPGFTWTHYRSHPIIAEIENLASACKTSGKVLE
jgi:hypothetical protein